MHPKRILLLAALALTALILPLASCVRLPQTPALSGYRVRQAPDGGVYIFVSDEQLAEAGLCVGDSVEVTLRGDLVLPDVPFYSADYAPPESACLTRLPAGAAGEGTGAAFLLRAPAGEDLWERAGLRDFRRVRLALHARGAYLYEENARAFYAAWSATADTGGFAKADYDARRNVRYVMTTFEAYAGAYGAAGEPGPAESGSHSQLVPVPAGGVCYVGYRDPEAEIAGAFFDDTGAFVAPLAAADIVSYEYRVPNALAGTWRMENGSGGIYQYPLLYCFKAPNNAAYVSLNLTGKPEYAYRQFLASMPVFALAGTGNMLWREDDPVYAATKDLRVCVIGQSNTMVDRLLRLTHAGEPCPERYIAGFQEYLIPWFAAVDTYGYSGKGYMRNGGSGIWDYVIGRGLDLSGYDIYLLTAGRNALTLKNVGTAGSADPATYCGAINALIDYIRAQNPADKQPAIYVGTTYVNPMSTNATLHEIGRTLNAQLRELAAAKGCGVLEYGDELSPTFTGHVYELFYDGKHANEIGGKYIGEFYRRHLVGF